MQWDSVEAPPSGPRPSRPRRPGTEPSGTDTFLRTTVSEVEITERWKGVWRLAHGLLQLVDEFAAGSGSTQLPAVALPHTMRRVPDGRLSMAFTVPDVGSVDLRGMRIPSGTSLEIRCEGAVGNVTWRSVIGQSEELTVHLVEGCADWDSFRVEEAGTLRCTLGPKSRLRISDATIQMKGAVIFELDVGSTLTIDSARVAGTLRFTEAGSQSSASGMRRVSLSVTGGEIRRGGSVELTSRGANGLRLVESDVSLSLGSEERQPPDEAEMRLPTEAEEPRWLISGVKLDKSRLRVDGGPALNVVENLDVGRGSSAVLVTSAPAISCRNLSVEERWRSGARVRVSRWLDAAGTGGSLDGRSRTRAPILTCGHRGAALNLEVAIAEGVFGTADVSGLRLLRGHVMVCASPAGTVDVTVTSRLGSSGAVSVSTAGSISVDGQLVPPQGRVQAIRYQLPSRRITEDQRERIT